MTGLKGVLAATGLCACAAAAVASEPDWYGSRSLTIVGSQPTALVIPGVLTIDLRSGKVTLDEKARTEPAEVAAEFWKAVELFGGARACKP